MIDDVAGGKLIVDVLKVNAHLHHQDHHVVAKVGDLIHGLLLVVRLARDDDLGAFLAHLL